MTDKYLVCMAGMITVIYSVYMISHVLQGSLVPDGIILSGVIGAVCVLAGVKYQSNKQRYAFSAEEPETATECLEP